MTESEVDIQHSESDGQGRYELLIDGEAAGELTYQRTESGTILATHTFVDPAKRQKGLARELVDRLAADAREEGVKISPVCPYVRWVFEKNAGEFEGVWDR